MNTKTNGKREITEIGRRILGRLRQMRPNAWSQADLARKCGRTDQWVTEILRRKYLAAPTIRLLVKVLDVSADYLMPEDDE